MSIAGWILHIVAFDPWAGLWTFLGWSSCVLNIVTNPALNPAYALCAQG